MTKIPSLNELWEREECPLVDGVIFNDGTVIEFHVTKSTAGKLKFEEKGRTEITFLLKQDPNNYKTIYHSTTQLSHETYNYMAGDGSWGGDGYLACLDPDTDRILWVFTSDRINPIVGLEFSGKKIIARNNLNILFSIEVNYLNYKAAIITQV